jgi:hypothetical protein
MAKRKKDKRTNSDVQNTTEKIKINEHEAHEKPRVNSLVSTRMVSLVYALVFSCVCSCVLVCHCFINNTFYGYCIFLFILKCYRNGILYAYISHFIVKDTSIVMNNRLHLADIVLVRNTIHKNQVHLSNNV